MDEFRHETEGGYPDSASEPMQPDRAYWKEIEEGLIVLFLDGELRAEVQSYFQNYGEIARGGESEIYILPDSMPMMDVIEKRLGIGRVDQVIGNDGSPAPELRQELERKTAKHLHEPRAAAREATRLVELAHEQLRIARAAKEITSQGKDALRLLTNARADHDFFMEWRPKAAEGARAAEMLLKAGDNISGKEERARFYCGLAAEALKRSAELDPPAFQERPGHGETYWKAFGRGYQLHIDGYHRATVWHDNSYEIRGSEIGRLVLPASKFHFTVVEAKLGQERIEDFRDADGDRMSPTGNSRAKIESEALALRRNVGRQKQPVVYLDSALDMLERSAERSEHNLSEEAREARALISAALSKVGRGQGKWTRETFQRVCDAAELFRAGSETDGGPVNQIEARCLVLCEKALACIGFGDIEKEDLPASSKDASRYAAIEKAARQEADRRDRDLERD